MLSSFPDRYSLRTPGKLEVCERNFSTLIAEDTEPYSVALMFDIDRFKTVNETLGYATGDQVLVLAGERLQSALGQRDRLLRLPGDEFAVLLHDELSVKDAGRIGDRLHDLIQRTYLADGHPVHISATVGVAPARPEDLPAEVLLRRAGLALRSGKSSRMGTVCFFEEAMEERMVRRHALNIDLRKALPLRQLELHFQPQVELDSQRLTGFEALLRWQHPEFGWISPADFIPLAEETGLISRLGEWVLRTACLRAVQLPDDVVVAVNASPLQLASGSFLQSVEQALAKTGIPPRRLEIEVTEGVLLKNESTVLSTLNNLRSIGVRLAMDDFGTGYSSLGQLANLPFHTIKLDRSLAGGSAKQRAIVRAITTLGHGIGMSTLVEGIETEEQLTKALSDGCTFGQGYFFGKAVPADQLHDVIARLSRPVFSYLKRGASVHEGNTRRGCAYSI